MPPVLRLAFVACAVAWVSPTTRAQTVLVDSVLATPTIAVSPTSFVLPTSYAVPTTYVPTTYAGSYATVYSLSPTSYYDLSPTSYVIPTYREARYYAPRRFFRNRPIVATSYYDYAFSPTSYYVPTTYVPMATTYVAPAATTLAAPLATTSESACDVPARVSTGLPTTEPAPTSSYARAPSARRTVPDRRSDPVVSVPRGEPTLQPDLARPAPAPRPETPIATPTEPESPPAASPPPRVAEPPAAGPDSLPPVNEIGDPAPAARPAEPRVVQRPLTSPFGILKGEVVSALSRQGEEGVKVVVSSRTDPDKYKDRNGLTDAYGHFAIRVPSGDWTIKVAKDSGELVPVQNVTVSGGQVASENGAPFPSLTINR